jgi:hypothetical protein
MTKLVIGKSTIAALEYATGVLAVQESKEAQKYRRTIEAFLARVRSAELKHAASPNTIVSFSQFHSIISEYIGDRLALPPSPSPGWYGTIYNRLRLIGVNKEQARWLAIAANEIRLPKILTIEFLLSRATSLIARGQELEKGTENGSGTRVDPSVGGREPPRQLSFWREEDEAGWEPGNLP